MSNNLKILKDPAYLQLTYSMQRRPSGPYPGELSLRLLKNVYHKTGSLLDIGCGRGDYLEAFSGLGFSVTGVDISKSASVDEKKFKVETADLEEESLPFSDNSFDFVFCKSVIEHMKQPTNLMREALRVLKPGGIAVVMTPSWEHTYWGPFYVDHTHVTPFTIPSLNDALMLSGFKEIDVSFFYQLPFLWRYPILKPFVFFIKALPISYRPFRKAIWSEEINKLIRFSKEAMLLAVAQKDDIEGVK